MARVTGKNGSVVFTNVHGADFSAWRLRADHAVDDDTAYSDTGSGASHSGSGSVSYGGTAAGFLVSNTGVSTPGIGTGSGGTGVATMADVDGNTLVLTAHTACTYTGAAIITSAEIGHAKRSGAIPVSYDFVIDGNFVEAWATT